MGKESIKKGSKILETAPFAYVIKNSLQNAHCDLCLAKRQVLQRCSGCKVTRYCNKDCQRTAWLKHKKECVLLKNSRPEVPTHTIRLIARIILRLKEEANTVDPVEGLITESRIKNFYDLKSHYNEIKEDETRQQHFMTGMVMLKKYMGEELLPSTNDLLEIYSRVCINSFNITDNTNNVVGIGLYLAASIFDHSCISNAYASFVGPKIVIRSLVDWPQLDLSKIRLCYLDIFNTTEQRRKELKERYYFWCDCLLCNNAQRDITASSIKCGNKSCDTPVPIDPDLPETEPIGKCPKCDFNSFDENLRKNYYEILNFTKNKLKDKDLETLKIMSNRQDAIFHKLNIWRVKTLEAAYEAAIEAAQWDMARNYCLSSLQGIKFYYGPQHPFYGITLVKLGKIEMLLLHIPEALQHLNEARSIVLISHGIDHSLVEYDLKPLLVQAKQEMQLLQRTGGKQPSVGNA